MDLGDNNSGLIAKEFEGVYTVAVITGDVITKDFTSKAGKTFKKFSLPVALDTGEATISNLMRSQLNRLVAEYGKDSTKWIGKPVHFTAVEDGRFLNWELYATPPTTEERVK